MKTLNNLKEASTIFALCAAFVLFLTSCEKEELANMNGTQTDQALQCLNCNNATQDIDFASGQIRNEKDGNNDLGKSRNNVDNAHNGQMPNRTANNNANENNNDFGKARNNVDNAHNGQMPNRTANNNTANETNSQYEKNKLVQYPVDVNSTKDRLEPIHNPAHK